MEEKDEGELTDRKGKKKKKKEGLIIKRKFNELNSSETRYASQLYSIFWNAVVIVLVFFHWICMCIYLSILSHSLSCVSLCPSNNRIKNLSILDCGGSGMD